MIRRTAVGIDLGTTDVCAANVGRKGVDIVQNAVSERRTAALVSFTDRRRLLGEGAFAQVRSNYKNSCRGLKHLVGRAWDSPELDAERLWSLCPLGQASDDAVGYQVSYLGEQQTISAAVCLSMLLTKIVLTCEAWTKMQVRDAVLAIPSYFTERHRQACLDAMRIAGIQCLRLIHESTAIALAWRFERRDFDDDKPIMVAFCSCGHSGMMVAIARFERGAVKIMGEAYDIAISGRAMDRLIMEMFAASLKKQGASDALASMKSQLKLEEAATKVKKTLSSSAEARASAECVVDDYDLMCNVTRSQFEEGCAPIGEKVNCVVAQALERAGLQASDLTYVEVVGGVSRVPWLQRALKEAFIGMELSTTLNADEAVAKGCAWQAAMLSTFIRLDQIPMREFGHFAVALEWDDSDSVEAEGSVEVAEGRRRLVVFERSAGPGLDADVGVRCRGTVEFTAVYAMVDGSPLPVGASDGQRLGAWSVAVPGRKMEDIELQCALDLNGLFSIKKVVVCTGKEAVVTAAADTKEAASGEGAPASGEGATASSEGATASVEATAEGEGIPAEAAPEADAGEEGEAAETAGENGEEDAREAKEGSAEQTKEAAEQEQEPEEIDFGEAKRHDKAVPREAEAKGWHNRLPSWRFWRWGRGEVETAEVEEPASEETKLPPGWEKPRKVGSGSKKSKRKDVPVKAVLSLSYSATDLSAAVAVEKAYRLVDEAIVEAEDRRNDYEKLVYELQSRTASSSDALMSEFATPEELAALKADVQAAEEWIDEHTDEEASVYVERLQHLQKHVQEFTRRQTELETINEKAKNFKSSIRKYKALATAAKFDHIAKEKLSSIVEECDAATQFIQDADAVQEKRKKTEPVTPSLAELTVRMSSLESNSMQILSEPRPKPVEPPKEEKKENAENAEKEEAANGKDGSKEGDAEGDSKPSSKQEDKAAEAKAAILKAQKERHEAEARRKKRRMITIVSVTVAAVALIGAAWYGGAPSRLVALWRMVPGVGGDDGDDEALVPDVGSEFDGPDGFASDEM